MVSLVAQQEKESISSFSLASRSQSQRDCPPLPLPLLASSSPSLCQITNAIEFGRPEPESVRSFGRIGTVIIAAGGESVVKSPLLKVAPFPLARSPEEPFDRTRK